jgi:ubiquinone/menaquinone biosynthesis C-methylase UbiE
MSNTETNAVGIEHPIDHFTARAERYNRSSRWCTDEVLGEATLNLAQPTSASLVLDVACGTGLVSRLFHGKVARVVGVDITAAMAKQAEAHLDQFVTAPGEKLPFDDNTFDIVVSRQGIQFMDDGAAVKEMVRVAKPGGRICLIQLCAYGAEDRDEFFEVMRLRNPARKNFYVREDLRRLLSGAGAQSITLTDHISVEDVDAWADNGAISEELRAGIRTIYQGASPAFSRLHSVRMENDHYIDHMLFCLARGIK